MTDEQPTGILVNPPPVRPCRRWHQTPFVGSHVVSQTLSDLNKITNARLGWNDLLDKQVPKLARKIINEVMRIGPVVSCLQHGYLVHELWELTVAEHAASEKVVVDVENEYHEKSLEALHATLQDGVVRWVRSLIIAIMDVRKQALMYMSSCHTVVLFVLHAAFVQVLLRFAGKVRHVRHVAFSSISRRLFSHECAFQIIALHLVLRSLRARLFLW